MVVLILLLVSFITSGEALSAAVKVCNDQHYGCQLLCGGSAFEMDTNGLDNKASCVNSTSCVCGNGKQIEAVYDGIRYEICKQQRACRYFCSLTWLSGVKVHGSCVRRFGSDNTKCICYFQAVDFQEDSIDYYDDYNVVQNDDKINNRTDSNVVSYA